MKNSKKKLKKTTPLSFVQSLYFTSTFFVKNDLLSYASACAFGFLFSFIPVVMLILIILLRFLHASPDTVINLLMEAGIISEVFNWHPAMESIMNIQKITNFEIVTVVAIFFMARRFFSSTISGLNCIFKVEVQAKPLLTQLFIFAGEVLLLVAVSVTISAILAFRAVQTFPIFEGLIQLFPKLLGNSTETMVDIIPQILIFLAILAAYKLGSGSKPPFSTAALCSLCTTVSFRLFQKLMNLFINVNQYNVVYGVLSKTIVLLLEVWFFFIFFLFFSQHLFVLQYFDTLILSELYILPDRDDTSVIASFKRILFINPTSLLKDKNTLIKCPKGSYIYKENNPGTDAYYILQGTVEISRTNNISYLDKGKFFGEQSCLLNEIRIDSARAYTDVEVLKIKEEEFYSILEKNPNVSKKALSQISNYFSKFYGRSDDNPL